MPEIPDALLEVPALTIALGTLYIAVRALAKTAWAKVRNEASTPTGVDQTGYDGPERRRGMRRLDSDLADLRETVTELRSDMKGMNHRLDRTEELQRTNDTQTAREIGSLGADIRHLEMLIAKALGMEGYTRTPPDGISTLPGEHG